MATAMAAAGVTKVRVGRVKGNVWRFGDTEFDEPRGRLTVAGEAADLDRNCAAILAVLLREAGREVSKERLLEAGWPDRIVHENSLAKAIGRLRRALGKHGEALRTVYGRGYLLEVEARPESGPLQEGAATEAPVARTSGRRWRWTSVALAGVAVVGLAILWFFLPSGGQEYRDGPPLIADAPDAIGRILWVDDHPSNNAYEKRFFEDHRIAVHEALGTDDAFRLLAMNDYDVVISDMGRGDDRLAGVRMTEQLRRRGNMIPVVIYTIRPDREDQQIAQRNLVSEAGAQSLAVTPQEVRSLILQRFGNPPRRAE